MYIEKKKIIGKALKMLSVKEKQNIGKGGSFLPPLSL